MMKRDECLKALARQRTDEIVVAVYKAAQEWIHLAPSDLNYTFSRAEGTPSNTFGYNAFADQASGSVFTQDPYLVPKLTDSALVFRAEPLLQRRRTPPLPEEECSHRDHDHDEH